MAADDIFDPWCTPFAEKKGTKSLFILTEKLAGRPKAVQEIACIIPQHYYPPGLISQRLKKLGYKKTAVTVEAVLPETKKQRSGDLGEILATEYVNRKFEFKVPVFRLRWKDGRDMALRGDDILAIHTDNLNRIHFLKGEVKSRATLSASTVAEAGDQLRRHRGRPAPFVVNFVANRLFESKQTKLYEQLENQLTMKRLAAQSLTHLLFTLSGNDSRELLSNYLESYSGAVEQRAVGLVVHDHQALVKAAFAKVKLG